MAQILDGKGHADRMLEEVRCAVEARKAAGKRPPCLAVVMVGENAASQIYVRNKIAACTRTGVTSLEHFLPETIPAETLIDTIIQLNGNPEVDGILLQLPLPKHLNAEKILDAIAFEKDVDGLHATNAGLTLMGRPHARSCTPYGVMKMLESIGVSPAGRHAIVLGRSNMVGKPMAMLLLSADATVTMAHSKTRDLAALTRQSDIVIAAVGRRGLVTADMVKPGAVVIDVGTNRTPEGKLVGDVDFEAVKEVAGFISPVPGGVGPMTITMLLVNTIEAVERKAART
jgi:methylenetetrahydrofolate dehydrogenase (NADP+)/methenyltetrahydrofolate cyclohydrolase